ncbi:cytidylate kinase [Arcanobacterium wilhelmae]|uniref:Cytidylate kinase n=1 Tax=Arcanobacterium wilhelmae TaxID=1803177 RepID=A0ABT9N8H5_9ACTO|nr:(d)CMP kinase [Arcanobacterium wilhelmae]MDP9800003.1 cytidylate kinase [Arcanobacterium wilhelmae]WFN89501.1 (d)CMP kinase [Arcanobacterium wilhelmae]
MIIAIDGPSGSGKSTVSKLVAQRNGLAYLDTGAMFRAAAWWAHRGGIDLDDQAAVEEATKEMPFTPPLDPLDQTFVLDGVDITSAIREPSLSRVVSKVAVNLGVRAELLRRQREVIAAEQRGGFSGGAGIVAEGRDITTVVVPEADVRVLLTASEEARLARRAREVRGDASDAAIEATRAEIVDRDKADSTVSEFMHAADGVTTIDSSALTIDQVVDAIQSLM